MLSCISCENELADDDRFCGECGTAVISPNPSRSEGPSMGELVTARSARFRRIMMRCLLIASAFAILSLTGIAVYYLTASKAHQGAIIRFAMGEGNQIPSIELTPEPPQLPSEEPTEASSEETTEALQPTPSAPAESEALEAKVIQPGAWSFTMSLFNVTKANPGDTSFELSRQGIGASETSQMCVSEAIASNPRLAAFPLPASLDCEPSSLVMAGGRYGSSMTCNFPQYGGRRALDVSGQYTDQNVSLTTRVRVPANIVSGEFARTPEIVLHYRIVGRRTGGC